MKEGAKRQIFASKRAKEESKDKKQLFKRLPVANIKLSENIRVYDDSKSQEYKSLLSSIKEEGLSQIPIVELRTTKDGEEFICVDGHRRLRALKDLGVENAVCQIRIYKKDVEDRLTEMLTSDIKESFHILDKARIAFKLKQLGKTVKDIAKVFQNDDNYIYKIIRLNKIPKDGKKLVFENKDKLNAKFLIKYIASRNLTETDIMRVLNERLFNKPKKSSNKKYVMKKLEGFFVKKKVTIREKRIILEALELFKVIK